MHFFEQFLVSKYIQVIFYKQNQKVISSLEFQDFIVKPSSKNIIIFEVKMTDLHPKTIETMDFEAFKTFIDQNFFTSKESGGKNKGVSQIIRQMENLQKVVSELRGLLKVKHTHQLNIYPIIIYSDINLDISGVNSYMNEQFETRITDLRKSFQSVRPVLMMNINTLLEYFYLLKSDSSNLTSWINDYFKSIRNLKHKYKLSKNPNNYFLYNKSFTNYLTSKIKGE